jgi:hypothetical protein
MPGPVLPQRRPGEASSGAEARLAAVAIAAAVSDISRPRDADFSHPVPPSAWDRGQD